MLKNLKNGVARDPLGYANEIFNSKVAGDAEGLRYTHEEGTYSKIPWGPN